MQLQPLHVVGNYEQVEPDCCSDALAKNPLPNYTSCGTLARPGQIGSCEPYRICCCTFEGRHVFATRHTCMKALPDLHSVSLESIDVAALDLCVYYQRQQCFCPMF